MDIDEELNPNPTLSPPNIITQTEPSLPPLAVPPIARIPRPPINGETAKKDDSNDDSGPEYEVSEESRLFREKQEKAKQDFLMKQRAAALALETLMRVLEDEEGAGMEEGGEDEGEAIQYPFYTEGSTALLKASEIGDDRPLSGCSFSSDGKFLATCSLTAVGKIWSMPEVKIVSSLKGHTERATDITFSPTNNHIATASADRTARLWNTEGTLLNTYKGHLDRLARVAFHPSGKYLGTTSFDKTWRMWDTETGEELLYQEGHSRTVYGLAFHPDGSLAASCGLDALARVWDLRSGRSILALEGHVKPVLGISFSPNGYHLATGGEDNTCRIWDLRKKRSLYTIPAHANLISQIKFEPQEGYILVTASYDMTAKVWSARDFKPVKVLSGHESKVTSVDVVADGQSIVTVSHDRTIKLWSSKNVDKEKDMDVD
ncbi:G-protein beta WD-40 repeat-containing protein [Artemisia annua]|uniref:G-protein beta WD-40 repeat-containing protein n=1 Tax=Artemisia annua TaxID=35608 RepID=A0A2U1M5M4_ARTAN|nr:G-protein beta WD-40 repeat-containing protein [Artemisia annua]